MLDVNTKNTFTENEWANNVFKKLELSILIFILVGVLANTYFLFNIFYYGQDCTGVWSELYDIKENLNRIIRNL